jgi:KDO2-lipid IV(A) lauroyltransferase
MGRARVIPLLARLTPQGYELEILDAWQGFPTDDAAADTALMNLRLQSWIETMPAQYFWVHKRFKTRPDGAPSVY